MTRAAARPSTIAPLAAPEPIVAAQQLTKVFKDFWMRDRARAVDSVSFEIRPHEIFGLLGPNGSGKSTTIKMILGLLKRTSGRLAVFGKPPTDVSSKKRIGYLPEESYLYPFLDARETLEYYGKLFEIDRNVRQRRIDELIDMVGLGNAQFRTVREYSKGMQRRLGLAQALINDPDFLILDEPTTGLDPIGTRQVKDLIIELGRRGKTVLLSSHLLADVEDCVDRMIILYGGKVRAQGTCGDLLESQSRTSIETETLDEDTVSEIDRVIRNRTGGAILKVTRPRQTLEALFLDIVERARAERLDNAGAQHGGQTAAFLRGDEGDALIDRLVKAESTPVPVARSSESEAPTPTGPDPDLISSLTREPEPPAPEAPESTRPAGSQPQPKPPARREPAKIDTSEVDRSVIDSLIDPPDRSSGEPESRG
jgi:ABC-2 type transport system ATP-binding protein